MAAMQPDQRPATSAAKHNPATQTPGPGATLGDLIPPGPAHKTRRALDYNLQELLYRDPRGLRLIGADRVEPISVSGVIFALQKLAETVIPVRISSDLTGGGQALEGPIRRVPDTAVFLHWHDAEGGWRLPLERICSAWIERDIGWDGIALYLSLFDQHRDYIAQLSGQRPQCIAWRALLEWVLLKENYRPAMGAAEEVNER